MDIGYELHKNQFIRSIPITCLYNLQASDTPAVASRIKVTKRLSSPGLSILHVLAQFYSCVFPKVFRINLVHEPGDEKGAFDTKTELDLILLLWCINFQSSQVSDLDHTKEHDLCKISAPIWYKIWSSSLTNGLRQLL